MGLAGTPRLRPTDLLWLLVDSAEADVLPIVFNMRLASADGRLPAAA